MARPKRSLVTATEAQAPVPNKRQKKEVAATASSVRPSRTSVAAQTTARPTRSTAVATSGPTKKGRDSLNKATLPSKRSSTSRTSSRSLTKASSPIKKTADKSRRGVKGSSASTNDLSTKKTDSTVGTTQQRKKPAKTETAKEKVANKAKVSVDVPKSQVPPPDTKAEHDRELEEGIGGDGPAYWLMKAEPESRIAENGKDVKFSIDDLKAATASEPWDGVRNAVARNNMRLMTKGDLAFFYHSNCKVPGIVGTMEIVEEHSVDKTAFDKDHPYYDEKSDPEKPKWHLVHVEFRQKFPQIIKLKELQKYAKDGGVLEHLQTLKQTRLSVSKVTKKEWDFIMDLVDSEDVAAASAQHQPNMVVS